MRAHKGASARLASCGHPANGAQAAALLSHVTGGRPYGQAWT
jgi:hypothetical protein